MLQSLTIQNVVLIQQLTIVFDQGFSAITGETGAGKSILLDALGLVLGARADASLVRQGASQATVAAVIEVPSFHPARALLEEQGWEIDDTLVFRRVLQADGKSKAFLNDQPASVQLLKTIGANLIDIHGQFDHLWSSQHYQTLLDRFGNHTHLLERTSEAYHAWRQARKTLEDLQASVQQADQRRGYLAHVLQELRQLNPQEGEEEQLLGQRHQALSFHKVNAALEECDVLLGGQTQSALGALFQVEKSLSKIQDGLEGLASLLARLTSVQVELADVRETLDHARRRLENGGNLDVIEERLHALRAAGRKHQVQPEALSALLVSLEEEFHQLEHHESLLASALENHQVLAQAYQRACTTLHEARIKAAEALSKDVGQELIGLKLSKAQFKVDIKKQDLDKGTALGMDDITFMVQTNPDTAWGPIDRIASGGEQSRLMLALKLVLAQYQPAQTLILDEIDVGVGGAVADAIGERLAKLGTHIQVLSITHAPQVAARADHHWLIKKHHVEETTQTQMQLLKGDERAHEIARMLSGASLTPEAQAAAGRLLENARG